MDEFDDEYNQENADNEGQTPSPGESNPLKQIRSQLRAEQKQRKEAENKLAVELQFHADFDAREKVTKTSTVFEEMGLDPRHAKLFYATSGQDAEPTAEAVAKFALEYGLGVVAEKQAEVEAAAEGPKFVPLSPGSAVPVRNMLTREQFTVLKNTDLAAAVSAVQEGRVEGFTAKVVPVDGGGYAAETTRGGQPQ